MNKSLTKLNILVTGAGGPAGINALRLLQKQSSVTAYATDIEELSAGRFWAADFATMSPVKQKDEYIKSLKNLVAKWDINVILPTVDEELPVIGRIDFGGDVKVIISSTDVIDLCDDKRKLYAWMDKNLPNLVSQWQIADQLPAWEADQYFIKPAYGRGSRGCQLIKRTDLEKVISSLNPQDYIIMGFLPGVEWTVDAYVNKKGEIVFCVSRERLALSGGISLKGKTVKHQAVIDTTTQLLSKLPCWGPVCVQWKANEQGEPRLIEVNPRLSGGLMITAAAGADPIDCLVQELLYDRINSVTWKEITVIRYFDEKIL